MKKVRAPNVDIHMLQKALDEEADADKDFKASKVEVPKAYWDAIKTMRTAGFKDLPTPRLQAEWFTGKGWAYLSYGLVRMHHAGDVLFQPLGGTKRGGSGVKLAQLVIAASTEQDYGLPFREAFHIRHDMHHLRLPAYLVIQKRVWRLDEYALPSPGGYTRLRGQA